RDRRKLTSAYCDFRHQFKDMTSGNNVAKIFDAHCVSEIGLSICQINFFDHRTPGWKNDIVISIDCLLLNDLHKVRENLVNNLLVFVLLEIAIKQLIFETIWCQVSTKVRIDALQY